VRADGGTDSVEPIYGDSAVDDEIMAVLRRGQWSPLPVGVCFTGGWTFTISRRY
jgi:hypothetical protein